MLNVLTQLRRVRRAGVRVTPSDVLGMWLLRVRAAQVLEAVAIGAEGGVDFPLHHAQTAYLAGSRPIEQARAAVIVAGRGQPVDLMAISACDIAGYDVVRVAQSGWDMARITTAGEFPGEGFRRPPT
jgi:uncharacterized protein YqfA (UPF0365 family)